MIQIADIDSLWGIVALSLGLGVVFVNGFTDAPSSVSGVVSSGIWPLKRACLISGAFNLFGVVIFSAFSGKVAGSVFNSADFGNYGVYGVCASLLGVIAFSVISWAFSMPSSESHALISCIFGASLALGSARGLLPFALSFAYMLFSCALSVLIALVFGRFIRKSREKCVKYEKISCILSSFMHGGQDGQKFIGLLAFLTAKGAYEYRAATLWLCAAVGIFMFLGTVICGKRIISSLGNGIVKNSEKIAFVSDFSSTVSVFICSLLGFSVSTGNIKACSLVGAGLCENEKINYVTVKRIVIVSLITFPVCICLGYAFALLFTLLC